MRAEFSPAKLTEAWDWNFNTENVHDPPERCGGAGYRRLLRVVFELLDAGDGAPTALNQQTVGGWVLAIELSRDL